MKVSEITIEDVVNYLRVDDYNVREIEAIKRAAIQFIVGYTSLTEEELDEYDDFYIVVLILCQDMHDNRSFQVENKSLNRTVETILGMHRRSLIG